MSFDRSSATAEVPPHGLLYGEAPDGRLISVEKVDSGIGCGLVCPQCRARLVAKKGSIIRHHFAHASDAECAGAAETLIHRLAKQVIADAGGVWLPPMSAYFDGVTRHIGDEQWVSLERIELETWQDGIRPDIVGYSFDQPLFIEIYVTHACDAEKVRFVQSKQIRTIEINLSNLTRDTQEKTLSTFVLASAPRRWIYHPEITRAFYSLRSEYESRQRQEREEERRRIEEARRRSIAVAQEIRDHEIEAARLQRVAEDIRAEENRANVIQPMDQQKLDVLCETHRQAFRKFQPLSQQPAQNPPECDLAQGQS